MITDQAFLEKWAGDIVETVYLRARIVSTVDGDATVLDLCAHSAFANGDELRKAIAEDLKESIDAQCDACRAEATSSV